MHNPRFRTFHAIHMYKPIHTYAYQRNISHLVRTHQTARETKQNRTNRQTKIRPPPLNSLKEQICTNTWNFTNVGKDANESSNLPSGSDEGRIKAWRTCIVPLIYHKECYMWIPSVMYVSQISFLKIFVNNKSIVWYLYSIWQ